MVTKKKYNFQVSTWVIEPEELDSVMQTLRQNKIRYIIKRGKKRYAIFRQKPRGLLKEVNKNSKKERMKCLKCNKSFWSTGKYNRLCESCRVSNTHFINSRYAEAERGKSYWGRYPLKRKEDNKIFNGW